MDLTKSFPSNMMAPLLKQGEVICMKGGIYSKERCPVCGKNFLHLGNDLLCPDHQTRPRRYYIAMYNRELGRNLVLCSDPARRLPFSSYEMAHRILEKIRSEIDAHAFDLSRYVQAKLRPLQFNIWVDEWLSKKEILVEKKVRTPSYLKELRRFVNLYKGFFGEMDIRDIGTKTIDDFFLSIRGKPKSQANILNCLHKMLADALDWGDIKVMPKFPKVEVPEYDFQPIDLEVQDRIINSIKDKMDRAYILFCAREMVRPSETRALCWDAVDLAHNKVTIKRHFSLNELWTATKSRSIKVLPLDPDVKVLLEGLPRHIKSPFVFHKEDGRPYSESYARKLWNRITWEMGIRISLYQGTRHSSATEAATRVSMDVIQEFLGHTSLRMSKRYVKFNSDRLKGALRVVK